MSKKDFEAIAAVNKARVEHYSTTESDRVTLYTLILEQARLFESINPRFNPEVFMRACGF